MYTTRAVRGRTELPVRRSPGLQWNAILSSSPRHPELAKLEAAAPNYQGGYVIRRQQKSWTGISPNIMDVRCDEDVHVDLRSEWTRLSAVIEAVGGTIEIRSRSWPAQSASRDTPLPLSLIPANLEANGQATGLRFMRHLVLQFDGSMLARMLEDEIDLTDAFAPRLMFSNPGIMHLAQLFAEECASTEPKSRLYGDTLSIALLVALSRLNASKDHSDKRGQ